MYQILSAFLAAFGLGFIAMPVIIRIARKHRFFSEPGERRSHHVRTPLLGGIGIFLSSFISFLFFLPGDELAGMQYLICALLIMFLVGIKDDFEPASVSYKFIFQLVAACVLVFAADLRLTGLYGIFAIHDIPYYASCLLSILTVVMIMNAFNLIDGINGLSGSIGVLVTLSFGTWFFMVGRADMSVLGFSVAGALFAFLYYNITPAKVFMGDTGSLFVGTVAAIMAIAFIEQHNYLTESAYAFESTPAVAIGILVIPLFDTLRLFIVRLAAGKSPFRADRNHIHHLLLDLGLSHMQGTAVLIGVNLLFILLVYQLQDIGTLRLILLMMALFIFFTGIIYYLKNHGLLKGKENIQNSYP